TVPTTSGIVPTERLYRPHQTLYPQPDCTGHIMYCTHRQTVPTTSGIVPKSQTVPTTSGIVPKIEDETTNDWLRSLTVSVEDGNGYRVVMVVMWCLAFYLAVVSVSLFERVMSLSELSDTFMTFSR
ncbi:hypothetical protein Btru_053719, partial [Bulinus truncatus]